MTQNQQLGRYKIEELIGSGAYADVYRAYDAALRRTVALKVLKPMLMADATAFARFTQEAQAAANLFHPQIATVLDIGEANGHYFIAMRYVEGVSLDAYIQEQAPIPWETAYRITYQIADALNFAHQRGLVHRDVKPSNILISETEGALLTDFGLVKAFSSGSLTATGSFLGTPSYIAPEIWKDENISPATDQYALACVLVEMLTGKVLYNGRTPPAIMAKHFQPPPLPNIWPSDVPAGLTIVLQRALAQSPEDRYPRMTDFVRGLEGTRYQVSGNREQEAGVSGQASGKIREGGEEKRVGDSGHATSRPPSSVSRPQSPVPRLPSIEWVKIPAGPFLYGESKKTRIIEKPYLIGKYPVTNAQYKRFLDANPKYRVPKHWGKKTRTYPEGKDDHPVVYVSWDDAQAFCKWAHCRLPTKEEWEKAARGTDGRKYPWGDQAPDETLCNFNNNVGDTTPVGQYSPQGDSPYGCVDMAGNVWEWVATEYGWLLGHALRGGSWSDGLCNSYQHRMWEAPAIAENQGFRVARDAGSRRENG